MLVRKWQELTNLEKKWFGLLPIFLITSMIVYGIEDLWGDGIIYIYLGIAAIIVYFLVRKSTYMLGSFNLSLMGHSAFEGVPKKVILFRYKMMSYSSLVAVGFGFFGGIYYGADLMIIFSWSLFGITVSSRRLVQEVSEIEDRQTRV